MKEWEVLQRPYAIDILLFLKEGPHTQWEIAGQKSTRIKRLKELTDAGLVTAERVRDHNAVIYTLSEKGKAMAELLNNVEWVYTKMYGGEI